MNASELLKIRLYNQLLIEHSFKEPSEIVSWMGAMQAQAFEMAKWAIGVRLKNSTVGSVEKALNSAQIIRTHILRPTWHFVSAEDIHWMFELSNPRVKPIYISYCKMSGIDESIISKTNKMMEKLFENEKHLTKNEIGEALENRKIKIEPQLLNAIISRAEMEGIICNGKIKGNKQSFTLLHEWVPKKNSISKEEALERLARKFFTSHAPASLQDFAWWSGLTATECKRALELIKHDFVSETINERIVWLKNDTQIVETTELSNLLLPPFDEFVVSYKDRSEIIEKNHYGKVMTKNGLFDPTIMYNGEIIGSWKKTTKKNKFEIDLSFFEKTSKKKQDLYKKELVRLNAFWG